MYWLWSFCSVRCQSKQVMNHNMKKHQETKNAFIKMFCLSDMRRNYIKGFTCNQLPHFFPVIQYILLHQKVPPRGHVSSCICIRRWPIRPSLGREALWSCKRYMPQYRGTPGPRSRSGWVGEQGRGRAQGTFGIAFEM